MKGLHERIEKIEEKLAASDQVRLITTWPDWSQPYLNDQEAVLPSGPDDLDDGATNFVGRRLVRLHGGSPTRRAEVLAELRASEPAPKVERIAQNIGETAARLNDVHTPARSRRRRARSGA